MADDIDELEKARRRMQERAEEEQEKAQAEEDAARLEDESRQAADEARRIMTEDIEFLKKSFKEVQEAHKKAMQQIANDTAEEMVRRHVQAVSKIADAASSLLSEAIHRSMRLSLDSSLSDVQPGFGRVGRDAAQAVGSTFGTMLGTYLTGNPQMGAMIGKIIGTATGFATDAVSMQAEGYQMIGASVAPMMTAGKESRQDFEQMGAEYRTSITEIGFATGATADQIRSTADALSKLGAGFGTTGKEETKFALAADRVLNLKTDTTLKMQTDLVTKYGESLHVARRATRDIAEELTAFTVAQKANNNAVAGAFSAGATLTDALAQIGSQARNSGASLESVNTIAMTLIQTMSSGKGGGTMRPEAIAKGTGGLIAGLMPNPGSSTGVEARRSSIDRMLMMRGGGAGIINRMMSSKVAGEMREAGMDPGGMNFDLLTKLFLSGPGRRGDAMRVFSTRLAGMGNMIEEGGGKAVQALLQDRMGGEEIIIAQRMLKELKERHGFDPGHDTAKEFKKMLTEHRDDPQYQETGKSLRHVLGTAAKQGDAMKSTMDHWSKELTKLSAYFNQHYWRQARNAFADAFGLPTGSGVMSILGSVAGVLGGDPEAISNAARGTAGIVARGSLPAAPEVHRQETTIGDHTANTIRDNETRNQGGQTVRGN